MNLHLSLDTPSIQFVDVVGGEEVSVSLFATPQSCHYLYSLSSTAPITLAVPQSSVLGPLMCLIYVNDMRNPSDDLEFLLFADNTNVLTSGYNIGELYSAMNLKM